MPSNEAADFATRPVAAAMRRSPLKQLYVQVLIAIAAGILLGHFYPSLGVAGSQCARQSVHRAPPSIALRGFACGQVPTPGPAGGGDAERVFGFAKVA